MVVVQIKCPTSREFALTKGERNEIASELQGELEVSWLPGKGQEPMTGDPFTDGHATEIILYIIGAEVAKTFIKPFVESILQEAGKDTWPKLKKLMLRLWKKQRQQSKWLKSTSAYIVLELFDEHIVFPFELIGKTDDEVAANLEKEFQKMLSSAEQIHKTIHGIKQSQGDNYYYPSRMHILYKKEDGTYDVELYMDYDSKRFSSF